MTRRRYYPTHTPSPHSRLRGDCELCGGWHQFPALRWECDRCGQVYCGKTAPAIECACGGTVRSLGAAEGIRVRLDDKLSRIAQGDVSAFGENPHDDIMGYVGLLNIAERGEG